MIYTLLNDGWSYRHLDTDEGFKSVRIPHDAMICEERSINSRGGTNTGWFEGFDYEYVRDLMVDRAMLSRHLELEFEGVYHNAEVYLNGEKLCFRPYGYTNFYVDLTGKVCEGKNTLRVIARNADQPNSRWYSGAGIYRNVGLWSSPEERIVQNGLTVKTLDHESKAVSLEAYTTAQGKLIFTVLDMDGKQVMATEAVAVPSSLEDGKYHAEVKVNLEGCSLWSPEEPVLYRLCVAFGEDRAETTFGIRTIITGKDGVLVNGKRVIIHGCCIHHDNGILGAVEDEDATYRKIRILRENGYNAVRSAHNPCSKTMLDACDSMGILVMDEYIDHWYIHKTRHDYVDYFMDWYRKDLYDMVQKDKNHPCVFLYSTGNEVSETAQKRGIELTEEMTEYLHSLDDTRSVTCGVNIFFNFLSSIGFGVYSDKKAENTDETKKAKAVGSQFFNNMAGLFGADFMKTGATLHGSDVKTREAFRAMDVAGYNYGIKRYRKDLKKYPDRLILGSETFCSDAYRFYELTRDNPRIIGDFVWSGMDYIGETGVGAWEYKAYAPAFDHGPYWLTAGSGRIDITGKASGESLYTKVAFNEMEGPAIAVRPVCFSLEKHSPSAWKMTDAMPSWSWQGFEGRKAEVEVYARAHRIELYLNGVLKGSRKLRHDCKAIFTVPYEDGILEAKAYDRNGSLLGTGELKTAGSETVITATSEEKSVRKGHLAFVRFAYTDSEGITKPALRGTLTLKVTGGKTEGFGNGCSYNALGYKGDRSETYYGECLAAIRADEDADVIKVEATDGERSVTLDIPVIKE